MRRNDKAINDHGVLESILDQATICRIALCDDGIPYMVPLNFGYADGYLYFHSATEGRKLEIIRKNSRVCFEVEADTEPVSAETPCAWTMRYRSIIGYGEADFLEDINEKRDALNHIVRKFLGREGFEFPGDVMDKIVVFRVKISEMTGKQSRVG